MTTNAPTIPTTPTQANPAVADAANAAVDATPALDLVALLIAPDDAAPAAVETTTPAAEPATPPAPTQTDAAAATTTTAAPTETPAAAAAPAEPATPAPVVATPAPTPGTPDKVVQQLQQDLAASNRKLDQLIAKQDAGQPLSAADRAAAAAAQRKIDAVREKLAAKSLDPIDDAALIADTLIEQDARQRQLEQQLQQQAAELQRLQATAATSAESQQWAEATARYAGVNVPDVWDKAVTEACRLGGTTRESADALPPAAQQVIANLANQLFHQRADAAAKSIAAKSAAAQPVATAAAAPAAAAAAPAAGVKAPVARVAPPVTPGGARVQQGSGVSTSTTPPSDESEWLANAAALVAD